MLRCAMLLFIFKQFFAVDKHTIVDRMETIKRKQIVCVRNRFQEV